ncbi:transposable element Tc3 transposase [Trichonephila clavipes]|nr:transposable element Tc3 transposase [Trichonephila clavipes]
MNPIEHVWNALGRRVAGRQPPPQTLQELERALLEEWDRIPQLVINSLIDSMPQRRPVPGRSRATTPAEDRFLALSARRRRTTTVPQLVADHFQASGKESPLLRCEIVFTMQVCMQEDQLCAFPSTDDSEGTAYAGQENMASTDLEEQRTRYHQSNTVERHSYRGGGILVWAGISLGGHTDLHVFHGGTVTGLRYRDEILDPYVRPYAAAIGNDFILMDDNARPHRARIVEEYLEDHGLERMEWPARSPDLNPIEHLWDYLGREVAALNPPPRSLHELKQGLLCVWSSLPIPVSDNLINSMGNRYRQCIQVRGGHIPY